MSKKPKKPVSAKGPGLFSVLKPYRPLVFLLAALAIVSNALNLWVPKIISKAIDNYVGGQLVLSDVALQLGLVSLGIFLLTFGLGIVQTVVSEKAAADIRNSLAAKISRQSNPYVQGVGAAKLLTNLTSDIDSVKLFVAQAVSSMISSIFLIVGASFLLLLIDWKLGLAVLTIVPIIGVTFSLTLSKVRALFFASREIIDRLNRVINESILGAALVRVLNTLKIEDGKFQSANADARDLGLKIIKIFAGLIPAITFIASCSSLIILGLGGHYVISGSLSLGDFAAFNSYMSILIFPILVIGFMSNIIAQADASYGRIAEVLNSQEKEEKGIQAQAIRGDIAVNNLSVSYGEKQVLKDLSFKVRAGTRTAILGPTAAGKTQLLYVLTGLLEPTSGDVSIDGHLLDDYDKKALHRQTGFVFQDSVVFNMTLRENIAFTTDVTDADLEKAIRTAELADLIEQLPQKLDSIVSERGTTLSGGQKQRLMLARALALNPKILMLDDFTARVDAVTEGKILANLRKNYPDLTLISVTQKIVSVEQYDQILLVMEGELLAQGTHTELLASSPEYMQIYSTQRSTTTNEL
jgi:ATP-binding cassette subfamily B protein